ncbi:hypothetical protein DL93DRAFT_2171385 [Clavulina sp. PMI_390]|nr:hypothetical protein DL93DRAFT_2171385 [Clavulina sp. PMI_390]
MPSIAPSPLPPLTRVVTGHNAQGQSTTLFVDSPPPEELVPGKNLPATISRFWLTKETPANNNDQKTDMGPIYPERHGRVQPNGSQTCVVDLPPGWRSVTHRTSSVDYIILISGTLTLFLDTNVTPKDAAKPEEAGITLTTPGSIVVQRGTLHTWENRSTTDWTRFVAVMVDAKDVQLDLVGDASAENVGPEGKGLILEEIWGTQHRT